MSNKTEDRRFCPDVCPITLLKFFMWIEHPIKGWVPTYGGPFDSYTLAEPCNLPKKGSIEFHDIEYQRERFDHDQGCWLIDEVECVTNRVIAENKLWELLDE